MGVETLQRSRRAPSSSKRRHSGHKIVPLPGGLYAERRRCNRSNCRCATGGDAPHGPYLFRRWIEGGQRRRQYVRGTDAERVLAGLAEWRRLHPPARTTRDTLAELRRLCRQLEILGW
jgi:hypothetical protein